MALTNHDQAKVRQYLLGHLSDEEQQEIEGRLMTEDDLFEELEISKGELIEEYVSGELTENERRWFKTHYLSSPEGRQRHTFTIALNCLKHPVPAPQPLTFFERLQPFFKTQRWAVATAVSVAVIAVIIVVWQPSRPQTALAVTLNSSVINRSPTDNQYPQIPVKPDVGEVQISLKLPEAPTPGVGYRVELDNRREIKLLKPSAHDASAVVVVIPARQLPPGFYALRVYAIRPEGTEQKVPGDYFFQITK
jgi:hypothetical protein